METVIDTCRQLVLEYLMQTDWLTWSQEVLGVGRHTPTWLELELLHTALGGCQEGSHPAWAAYAQSGREVTGRATSFLSKLVEQIKSPLGWLRLEWRTGVANDPSGRAEGRPYMSDRIRNWLSLSPNTCSWHGYGRMKTKCFIIFWKQDQHLIFIPHNYWFVWL